MTYSGISHHLKENLTYARQVERNFLKKFIPFQEVCNMLEVSELPK